MTLWQIRSKEYTYTNDSPIIFEGTKEKALEKWEKDGYKKGFEDAKADGIEYFAGLYEVKFILHDGANVKKER